MSKRVMSGAVAGGVALLAIAVSTLLWQPALLSKTESLWCGFGVGLLIGTILWSRQPRTLDTSTPAMRQRYLRSFVPAAIAYALSVMVSAWLLKHVDAPVLRTLVALLPVPAIALGLRAVMRYVREADEMQQRIELEAVSMATAGVCLLYLAGSLLQSARLVDIPSGPAMAMVLPIACIVYGIAKVAVVRRYA